MLQIAGETITKWRNRYAANENELAKTEEDNPRKLRSVIEKILSDEQVACITG